MENSEAMEATCLPLGWAKEWPWKTQTREERGWSPFPAER